MQGSLHHLYSPKTFIYSIKQKRNTMNTTTTTTTTKTYDHYARLVILSASLSAYTGIIIASIF